MISIQDRRNAVLLIRQARAAGASLAKSCQVVGISIRTHQRWTRLGEVTEDQRSHAYRPTPANALTAEEEAEILAQCHRQEFVDLPPDQIVVRLMDEEQRYIASPSSYYRVLRKHNQLAHRGRAKSRKEEDHTDHPSRNSAESRCGRGTAPGCLGRLRDLLLSGDDRRCFQPKNCGLGSLSERVQLRTPAR